MKNIEVKVERKNNEPRTGDVLIKIPAERVKETTTEINEGGTAFIGIKVSYFTFLELVGNLEYLDENEKIEKMWGDY